MDSSARFAALVGFAFLLVGPRANAMFAYELGFQREITAAAGTVVPITYIFRNTGNEAINFLRWSDPLGSKGYWRWNSASYGSDPDSDWNAADYLTFNPYIQVQHFDVTIDPGESQLFTFGYLQVPTFAVGSSSTLNIGIQYILQYGDRFWQDMLSGQLEEEFHWDPPFFGINVTIGQPQYLSAWELRPACIRDYSNGDGFASGAAGDVVSGHCLVPEPGTLALLGLGLAGLCLGRRRNAA